MLGPIALLFCVAWSHALPAAAVVDDHAFVAAASASGPGGGIKASAVKSDALVHTPETLHGKSASEAPLHNAIVLDDKEAIAPLGHEDKLSEPNVALLTELAAVKKENADLKALQEKLTREEDEDYDVDEDYDEEDEDEEDKLTNLVVAKPKGCRKGFRKECRCKSLKSRRRPKRATRMAG